MKATFKIPNSPTVPVRLGRPELRPMTWFERQLVQLLAEYLQSQSAPCSEYAQRILLEHNPGLERRTKRVLESVGCVRVYDKQPSHATSERFWFGPDGEHGTLIIRKDCLFPHGIDAAKEHWRETLCVRPGVNLPAPIKATREGEERSAV